MCRLRHTAAQSKERLRRLADEELMELVAASDTDAFEVILERHADAAFALAYRMCGRHAAADDITQESCLAVWRNGARYDRGRGSVRTWVLSIAHHRAIDALRRSDVRDRRHTGDEGIEDRLEADERTDTQAIDNAASREIRGALGALPTEQRQVIELAYFAGYTQTEIASMLDTPIGTVKSRMRLGLDKLRDHLRGWEVVGT